MASLTPRFEKGNQMPIGTSIQSMLTEAQFQAANGSGWILADGRSVSGSRYATLTGNSTVPDCRGEFIRGLDNGRGVDSGRVKGSAQAGDFGSHNHGGGDHSHYSGMGVVGLGYVGGSGGILSATGSAVYTGTSGATIATQGNTSNGNETRPRNIAMNIFIKIN